MPIFAGFVGPTYTSQSRSVDGERCVNLYPEKNEGNAKSSLVLYGTPGRKLLATLPTGPVRALYGGDNRLFGVGGAKLYEIMADGSTNLLGDVGAAGTPCTIDANTKAQDVGGNQLFIVSGAKGFIAGGTTVDFVVDAVSGTYIDTYFAAQVPNSNGFRISKNSEGKVWDALDIAYKEGSADRLVRVIADHEQLWLFGQKTIEIWYNSGNNNFPFQRIPGAFIEQGCWAPWSVCKADNSLFWLGSDDRGVGLVYRSTGYRPTRISNHAVEAAIESYANSSDAEGFSYENSGHTFYQLNFPTADVSWVYDCSTGMWHERGVWDGIKGRYGRDRARCHATVAGLDVVGDYANGNIYQQSTAIYDDNGAPIRRLRSSPHSSNENQVTRHRSLQIDMEVGGAAAGKDATVAMRFSDDGGFTWSNEREASAGKSGKFRTRVKYRRLGASRDRCYEIVISDPIKVALVAAYLETSPGIGT